MDIVISEFMDDDAVLSLRQDYSVLYDPALHKDWRRAADEIAQCRALIVRNMTQVRGDLLDAASQLVAVGRLGVGLDNIDLAVCQARNIAVLPATGANDTAVAEYVIAAILTLVRGSYGATPDVAAGAWPRNALIGREVAGRVLGLIGFGGIARQVARRAAALGMELQAFDPHLPAGDAAWSEFGVTRVDLDTLLAGSDAVSLHVPLTDATRGLLGTAALAAMKPGAVLINTARGGVVDEAALAEALRSGRLRGAAIDVFGQEPLPAANAFQDVPNLILTPHIAGVTEESNRRVSAVTAENVRRVLRERG